MLARTCLVTSIALSALAGQGRAEDRPSVDTTAAASQLFQPFARSLPFQTFSGERIVTLFLADPAKPPADLKIHVGTLRASNTHVELQEASVSADRKPTQAGVLPIAIRVAKLKSAGSFELPVQIWEPGHPVQRFTIGLSAGDGIAAPLFTILLGVVASFGLRHLADRYEPRQRLLAEVADLRDDIGRFLRLSSAIERRLALKAFESRLNAIENDSDAEDLKAVGQRFNAVKTEVEAFHTAWVERAGRLAASIDSFRTAISEEGSQFKPPLTDAEEPELEALTSKLQSVEDTLSGEALDTAERGLTTWGEEFFVFRLSRQKRFLEILIDAMPGPGEETYELANSLRRKASLQLNDRDVDAARTSLVDLSDLLFLHRETVPEALQERVGSSAVARSESDVNVTATVFRRSRANLARLRAGRARFALAAASMAIGAATGLATLYFGKPFGTIADYLLAAVWGFGSDSAVQNADALIKRLRGASAS